MSDVRSEGSLAMSIPSPVHGRGFGAVLRMTLAVASMTAAGRNPPWSTWCSVCLGARACTAPRMATTLSDGQDGREKYRSDHNQRADEEDGPDQRREHDRRRAEDARPANGPPTTRRLERHARTCESYFAVRRHRWCCPPEVSRRGRPLTR
jgi:hypothetical protein